MRGCELWQIFKAIIKVLCFPAIKFTTKNKHCNLKPLLVNVDLFLMKCDKSFNYLILLVLELWICKGAILFASTRVANNEGMKYGTQNKGDVDESPPQAKIFFGGN